MKVNLSIVGSYLLPLSIFTLFNFTALSPIKAEELKDLSQLQNIKSEEVRTKNIEQSRAIWEQPARWLIAPEYKINSQLKPQEAIDWENIEVNFDSELELNL